MSKTWETKMKILKLMSTGVKTPGEVSRELNLAPSTVSEHVEELENMGAITRVDNPYVKKWKYYKANPSFNAAEVVANRISIPARAPQIIAAIILVSIGALAFLTYAVPAFQPGSLATLQLTDPPHVPNGTQALVIAYSALQVHQSGASNMSGWISSNSSGSIDLMTLLNTSQVIGRVKVTNGSSINMIRFDITSASIKINGTAYNVTVPSGTVTAHIVGESKLNGNATVLVDLSPTVETVFSKTTNTPTQFVLVPSVKAVILGGEHATAIGAHEALSANTEEELQAATPNVTITGESLKVSLNRTLFTVTVANNGNTPVVLRHVLLFGVPNVLVSANVTANAINSIDSEERPSDIGMPGFGQSQDQAGTNASVNTSEGESSNANFANLNEEAQSHTTGNSIFTINITSALEHGGNANIDGVEVEIHNHANASAQGQLGNGQGQNGNEQEVEDLVDEGLQIRMFRVLNFEITSNGTLVLPFEDHLCSCGPGPLVGRPCPLVGGAASFPCIAAGESDGNSTFSYTLQPHSSATFTFSGQVLLGNGHLEVVPTVGSKYMIDVVGEETASAAANVTAVAG